MRKEDYRRKIVPMDRIASVVEQERSRGNSIVTYNGSFDLLHAGHVRSIWEASRQGDVLVIGLNSDESIRSYKGKERPIVPEQERAEMLAALEFVDYVVIFNEMTPLRLLELIRPDIHCNGPDWGCDCIERLVLDGYGGKLHILEWSPGRSTTALVDKIRSMGESPAAVLLCGNVPSIADDGMLEALKESGFILVAVGEGASGLKSLVDGVEAEEDVSVSLLERIRDRFGLSLSRSWLVSDIERDIECGRMVNMKTMLIGRMRGGSVVRPHCEVEDFTSAVRKLTGG